MMIHLLRLDAIASLASGKLTVVYVDDDLDNALGQATYAPAAKRFCIWLHSSLMPGRWRQDQLVRVFYHEAAHIACNHINPAGKHWHPQGLPLRANPADSRANSGIGSALLAVREQEADACAAATANRWPFAAYCLNDLITGKETYP